MLEILGKNILGSQPGWRKHVEQNGQPAKAVVLANPRDYFKGIPKYEGADVWMDIPVRVEPSLEASFEAKMKCQLSQILGGMLEANMQVNVKYDPEKKERVLLVDDVNALLQSRIKK
jgi:hypothetical protein